MAFQKVISAAVASTALIVSGMTPAMAAPINPGVAPATPIAAGALGWNEDASTANGWRSNRGYRGYRGYRGHRHRRGRINGGDVVAGILILGGIAAIASAASKNKRDRRADDRDRDYRSEQRYDDRRYDQRNDNDRRSQVGTTGIERAISVCSEAAERKAGRDARTSEITAVAKDGNGWRVEGTLSNSAERNFLCGATNDRVDFVQLGSGDLAYAN